MQVPQQFGSASSYAKKYALGNLLLIDDTQDSDATNTHGRGEKTKVTLTAKTDPAFKKAVEYVKAGGSVDNIKKKYALSKEVEAELMTL
jgi:ribosomal protein L31